MKARLKGTDFTVDVNPYYSDGWFMGYQDMAAPPGVILYKPEQLDFGSEPDWSAFRREAAKAAMEGILASGDGWSSTLAEGYKTAEKHSYPIGIARFAIACADELIRQLKEED